MPAAAKGRAIKRGYVAMITLLTDRSNMYYIGNR